MKNTSNNTPVPDPFGNDEIPAHLERSLVNRLKKEKLVKPAFTPLHALKIAAMILIFVSAVGAGWMWGRAGEDKSEVASVGLSEYMLLLHNSKDFVESEALVGEYEAWFMENYNRGSVIAGGELAPEAVTIEGMQIEHLAYASGNAGSFVSGYFIIRAASLKDAEKIAATCPHYLHKGLLELRTILQ